MIPPPLPQTEEPRPPVSAGLGVFNAFIDPIATAKAVRAPWAWVWPLIVASIIAVVYSMFFSPLMIETMRKFPPNGASSEQMERGIQMTEKFMQVGMFVTPVIIVGFTALFAGLIMLMAAVMSLKVQFRDLFSLLCACGLINALQVIASYFVLKAKADEIGSMQQLQPPFGLDIFFSDLKGPLFAILNYFSLFQIWYLVMLTLSFAYLAKTSKGKAFAAITPAWLVPLLFKIVGSLFQRG